MLGALIQGRISDEHSIKVDYDKTATNGSNTDEHGNKRQLQQTPLMDYFEGQGGYEHSIEINPGKAHALKITAMDFNTPNKISGEGLVEASSFNKFLTESGIGSITNASNGIYVGDQFVDSAHFDRLIYSGGGLSRAYLPVTTDEHGQVKPNLEIVDQYEKALKELSGNTDLQYIQRYLDSHGLSDYFIVDSNGELKPNPQTTRAFLMVNVFGDGDSDWFGSGHDGVFDPDDSQYLSRVSNMGINEDDLEVRLNNIMKKDFGEKSKYNKQGHLYSGMAFIPIQGTQHQAATASGQRANSYIPTNLLDQMSRDKSNQFKQTPKSVLSDG